MTYKLAIAAIACFGAASCGALGPSISEDTPIEEVVRIGAGNVNAKAPIDLGQVKLMGARAEGNALVMTFDTAESGSVSTPASALSRMFRPQICGNANYREIIDRGGIVRIEIKRSKTNEALPTFSIAQCAS